MSDIFNTLITSARQGVARSLGHRERQEEVEQPPGASRRQRGANAILPRSSREPIEIDPNMPMAPGGVTANAPDPSTYTPDQAARYEAQMELAREAGASAGAIAERSRYAPVIPSSRLAVTTSFPMGPGGVIAGGSANILTVAADATGASEEFLRRTVGHESGGDNDATPGSSSALGQFQFIEDTWLDQFARHGAEYGQGELAGQIRRRGGRYVVDDPQARETILNLRRDPQWSSLMGGHLTQENAAVLRSSLRRTPTEGEVYLAHFIGVDAAVSLTRAALATHGADRNGRLARDFVSRAAVEANPRIFYVDGATPARFRWVGEGRGRHQVYAGGGRPATAREVYVRQTRNFRDPAGNARIYTGRADIVRANPDVKAPAPTVKNAKPGDDVLISSRDLADEVTARQQAERQGSGLQSDGELGTAEERRLQREQERRDREAADRQRGGAWSLRGNGVEYRRRF